MPQLKTYTLILFVVLQLTIAAMKHFREMQVFSSSSVYKLRLLKPFRKSLASVPKQTYFSSQNLSINIPLYSKRNFSKENSSFPPTDILPERPDWVAMTLNYIESPKFHLIYFPLMKTACASPHPRTDSSIQLFISLYICLEGFNRLRNSDCIVKKNSQFLG